MSEWKFESLENVAKIKGRIGWKGYKTSDLRDSGPIVFSGTEIKSNSFIDFSKVKHLTEEKFEESPEIMLRDKDIMVATRGSLGQIGFYRSEYGPATINPSLVIVSEFKGIPEYLFYYFISKIGQENILAQSSGTTIPAIYQADLKKIIIPLPPLPTQKAIAEILSSLDDKIELNNQINQNLEALAQALFKQWFVDFEFPNENGEPYKSSGGEMIDSELGEIPKGWEVVTLDKLLTVKYGKDHKTVLDGNIPIYGSGGIMRFGDRALYDKVSILIPRKGTLSNLFFLRRAFWSVDTMFYTEIHSAEFAEFLFFWIKSLDIASMNVGSAVPSMTTKVLNQLLVVKPDNATINVFHEMVKCMLDSSDANTKESDDLKNLRDTLLPKLISGELEVNESLLEPTF
jgi:type I restriction enzyme S subunit